MPNKIANIAKNTSYFTLALIIQKLISFTYFTLYARYLGPEDLGKFYFAISITTICSVFIDLGLANVLTRTVARRDEEPKKFFQSILGIKLPLAALTWILAIILAQGNSDLVKNLIYLASISMVLDSFSTSFYSYFRGHHNLKYESIGSVGVQIVVLISALAMMSLDKSVIWLMVGLPLASIVNFAYTIILAKAKFKLSLRPTWNWFAVKTIFAVAWPFGLYAILQRLYTYFDSVLLFKLAGDWAVGIYQVPFKIVNALQFLPMAFVASLYPALSMYWRDNREQLKITFERALNYSTIISLPIMAGVIALSDKVVLLFNKGFHDSILPLQLIMISLFFIFIHFPLGSLLNACDRQRTNTRNMAIVVVASVLLNLLLIPLWGPTGAALTVLITNVLLFVLSLIISRQITAWRWRKVLPTLGKALSSALIMAGVILFLKAKLSFFLLVPLGGLIYALALYGLGGVKREDMKSILVSFKR